VIDRYALLRMATASSVMRGPGATAPSLRQAVAEGRATEPVSALVEKIRSRPHAVTDQDLDGLRSAYSEEQLFEIIVAAAFGAAQERLCAALAALEKA